jgi:PIN domain nuclease of toxin-antitoxin system
MNCLIDTHALLWFFAGSKDLSVRAKMVISNPLNKNYISMASIWEIGIKVSIGKLTLGVSLEELRKKILDNRIEILPLSYNHVLGLSTLEDIHKDPFDRILICQARAEKLTLITRDPLFGEYKKIRVCW